MMDYPDIPKRIQASLDAMQEREISTGLLHRTTVKLTEMTELVTRQSERIAEMTELVTRQSTRVAELEAECERLRAWKEEAIAFEGEWDAQKIAEMLGARVGDSCRRVIAEKVPLLIARAEAAEAALAAAREENERLRRVIAGFNPRVDAADFDQLAEVGRSIEESRKCMEEIQDRLALRSRADDASAACRDCINYRPSPCLFGHAVQEAAESCSDRNRVIHGHPYNADPTIREAIRSRTDDAGRVERVAECIRIRFSMPFIRWEMCDEKVKDAYRQHARAVLAAADGREP